MQTKNKNTDKELTNEKYDESVLKPTDQIEHLFTENVYAMYGDWKREMKIGVKARLPVALGVHEEFHNQVLQEMILIHSTNSHHQITKTQAIAMVRDEKINDNDDHSEDDSDDAVNNDPNICEDRKKNKEK